MPKGNESQQQQQRVERSTLLFCARRGIPKTGTVKNFLDEHGAMRAKIPLTWGRTFAALSVSRSNLNPGHTLGRAVEIQFKESAALYTSGSKNSS